MLRTFFCSRCDEPLEDADTSCAAHPDAAMVEVVTPHPHTCPECTEGWQCEETDCEPGEQEKLCNHCRQAYLC